MLIPQSNSNRIRGEIILHVRQLILCSVSKNKSHDVVKKINYAHFPSNVSIYIVRLSRIRH